MAEGGGSFDQRVAEIARGVLRAGDLDPAPASAGAQSQGGGINIGNVRRGVGRSIVTGLGGNITVSATSYAPLTTPLRLEMVLSGRPLKVTITGGIASGAGGFLFLDVTLRKARIGGVVNGLVFTDRSAGEVVTGVEIVEKPARGSALLEVVAFRLVADGFILADGSNRFVLLAEEL